MKNFLSFFRRIFLGIIISITMVMGFYASIPSFAISITEDPCNGESCFHSGIKEELLPQEIKTDSNIRETIIEVINYILTFVGLLLLIMIIYAGVLMIVSNGEDEAYEKSKKMFLYALLGIIIIILSYTIVSFLGNIGKELKTSPSNNGNNTNTDNNNNNNNNNNGNNSNNTNPNIQTLEKQLADLQKQLDELRKNNNPNAEEIAALEKQITALEKELSSSTGSLEKELDTLLKSFNDAIASGKLSAAEILALKQSIEELKKRSEGIPGLEEKYNQQITLIEELLKNPNDKDLQEKIKKLLQDITITAEKSNEIIAKMTILTAQKTVPTTLSLSAEKSYIKGTPNAPLANDAFVWSIISGNGQEQIIGNGMLQTVSLSQAGNYIIKLHIKSSSADTISGETKQSFIALPESTKIEWTANGKQFDTSLSFTQAENTQGILFTPAITEKIGRTISSVVWHFGSKTITTNGKQSVLYRFPKSGVHQVYVETIDNTGEKIKSKPISISIQNIVAYFSLDKKTYALHEAITFSGAGSKSDGGNIQEYNWKFANDAGTTVAESSGANTIEKFSTPGVYTALLTVKDVAGNNSTFYKSFTIEAENPTAAFKISPKENSGIFIFDASGSQEPSAQKLTYSWDFDNDGIFEMTKQESPIIEYSFPKAGNYTVALEVQSPFGKKSKTTKKVTATSAVSLQLETSSIAGMINTPIEFTTKHQNAKAFEWNFGDGSGTQITNESTAKHSFTKSGKYIVHVKASDEAGQTAKSQKIIFIGESAGPTAVIMAKSEGKEKIWQEDICGSGKHGIVVSRSESLTFSADSSINKNGNNDALTYRWKFPENITHTTADVPWKFTTLSENGNCESVQLIVKDTRSGNSSQQETMWILVENSKPKINKFIITPPKNTSAPASISLSVQAVDSDAGIKQYTWWATRIGGDPKEKIGLQSTQKPNTMLLIPPFGDAGLSHEYIINCSIEDMNGGKTTCQEALGDMPPVSISTVENIAIETTLAVDKAKINLGDSIIFTATTKTKNNVDVSSMASYKWDFDGDNIFDETTDENSITHKYTTSGTFTPRVKVIYQGLSKSASQNVEVALTTKLPLAKIIAQKGKDSEVLLIGEGSTFDTTVSGNALKYEWDTNLALDSDGDGKKDNDTDSQDKNTTVIYDPELKKVKVKLNITDVVGAFDSLSQTISLASLSGIVAATNEKNKTQTKQSNDITEMIQDVKKLLEKPSVSKDEISAIKEKMNTLKNTSLSAQTQSQLANLESVIEKLESNPSDIASLKSEIEKTVQKVEDASGVNTSKKISSDTQDSLQKVIADLETKAKAGTLENADVQKAENILLGMQEEIKKNPTDSALQSAYNKAKESIVEVKSDITNIDKVAKAIQSFKNVENASASDGEIVGWKRLNEMDKKINRSLTFTTKNPYSVLDLYGGEKYIGINETIQVFIFAKNADGTFYSGPLQIKIIKGEGTLSTNTLQASEGRAIVDFTPISSGEVSIEVTASDIVSGSLSESLQFLVE